MPSSSTKSTYVKLPCVVAVTPSPWHHFHTQITLLFLMVLDPTASGGLSNHIQEFEPTSTITLPSGSKSSSAQLTPVLISNGLTPIPGKLVTKAQEGLFIEMSNLLPSKLISAEYYSSDSSSNSKQKSSLGYHRMGPVFLVFTLPLFHKRNQNEQQTCSAISN